MKHFVNVLRALEFMNETYSNNQFPFIRTQNIKLSCESMKLNLRVKDFSITQQVYLLELR